MSNCLVQILGSESFTRLLVWGAGAQELGKIGKFLYPLSASA